MLNEKFDPFVSEWISFATSQKYSLVEKCLKLAQLLEYPELDIERYIQKINEIGKVLKLSITDVKNPTYRISVLNEYFFQQCGYRGNTEDYYNPKNTFLNEVIEKKTGLPITLSILYSEIAKHIGLDLKIVGFPGHVIVKYDEEIILDPFNHGRLLDRDKLEEILFRTYGDEVEFSPEFLNKMSDEQILIRIIRNLKNSYTESFAYEKALRCTNMILALKPNFPEDIRDKGIIEERLLHHQDALTYLNQYLELLPDAEDADFVLELIRSVREKLINN